MGFVLQTETALEKSIIIIQTNLTVTFVTGTRHNFEVYLVIPAPVVIVAVRTVNLRNLVCQKSKQLLHSSCAMAGVVTVIH